MIHRGEKEKEKRRGEDGRRSEGKNRSVFRMDSANSVRDCVTIIAENSSRMASTTGEEKRGKMGEEKVERQRRERSESGFSRRRRADANRYPPIEYLEHERTMRFFVGISGSDLSNGKDGIGRRSNGKKRLLAVAEKREKTKKLEKRERRKKGRRGRRSERRWLAQTRNAWLCVRPRTTNACSTAIECQTNRT